MDMLDTYKEVAERYKASLIKDPRVEGVVYLGALARGFADEYSDIDIGIFSNEPMPELILGEQVTNDGYDIDMFHINMREGLTNWTEIQKEAYQEGKLIYDKNDRVSKFLEEALLYSDEYRVKRALKIIFDLAWHGWVYSLYRGRKEKGYKWSLPEDLWLRRGSIENMNYIAQICVSHLIELMFVINRKWLPDYKWRYIKMSKLAILPNNAINDFDYLLYEVWSLNTWKRKKQILQQILDDAIEILLPDLPKDNWYGIIEH